MKRQTLRNLNFLLEMYDQGKIAGKIFLSKKQHLEEILHLIAIAEGCIFDNNKSTSIEEVPGDYLSSEYRHSTDFNKKEAARLYSISQTKANNPDLY